MKGRCFQDDDIFNLTGTCILLSCDIQNRFSQDPQFICPSHRSLSMHCTQKPLHGLHTGASPCTAHRSLPMVCTQEPLHTLHTEASLCTAHTEASLCKPVSVLYASHDAEASPSLTNHFLVSLTSSSCCFHSPPHPHPLPLCLTAHLNVSPSLILVIHQFLCVSKSSSKAKPEILFTAHRMCKGRIVIEVNSSGWSEEG